MKGLWLQRKQQLQRSRKDEIIHKKDGNVKQQKRRFALNRWVEAYEQTEENGTDE